MPNSNFVFSGKFTAQVIDTFLISPSSEQSIHLAPYELIVPIALTPPSQDFAEREKFTFPTKIDPGFSGTFHISLRHFPEWAKWPEKPQITGTTKYFYANGFIEQFVLYRGWVWLSDTSRSRAAKVTLPTGFTICHELTESGDPIPRIPLLGQRALRYAKAKLQVDYQTLDFQVSLP